MAGIVSLASTNAAFTAAAFALIALVVLLVWRPGEPPVLVFAVGYQWLQVAVKIFHANALAMPVMYLFPTPEGVRALVLSLVGLAALTLGMRVAMLRLPPVGVEGGDQSSRGLSVQRAALAYFGFLVADLVGRSRALGAGGLTQALLAALNLKWFFFFILAYLVLRRRRGYAFLLLAVGLELVVGFTGFFSAFKEVFFVLLVTYLTARPRFSFANSARVGIFIGGLFALGVLWMTVRGEYRGYVSGGERAQVVRVAFVDRLRLMFDLLLGVDAARLRDGLELFAERLAYVDYFSQVLFMVPRVVPHENGALWRDAILHVLKPRLLFPNKPNLPSDSELTMKYTGSWLASEAEGASISMGYFAESYIDFGATWMMAVIFAVGLAWGAIYRYFITRPTNQVYGFAAAVTVLIRANQFEMHNVKLVGSVLMGFLVTATFMKWVLPFLHGWLRLSPQRQRRAQARHLAPEMKL
jgi:hypothetical protein